MTSDYALPDLYDRWVSELLPTGIPAERGATCDECAMCVTADGRLPTAAVVFRPDVKCCVFLPRLPNFVVGRILSDPDPALAAGRRSVEARIAAGVGVVPLGLERPPRWELLHRGAASAFGNSRELRCPHFDEADGGRCGIWRHREATCTTWFCRFVRGAVGASFWYALRQLLAAVERDLARALALELGVEPELLRGSLTALEGDPPPPPRSAPWNEVEGRVEPADARARWGAWAGRERELYQAAGELAASLSWSGVLARCGSEVALRARLAAAAHARLVGPAVIPDRLRVGSFQVATTREGGVRIVSHTPTDALDLPSALVALLPWFDGRPTAEVLAQLREQAGVAIDPDFLRQLVDWQVLVPA